jgi:hypothetical protein
MDARLNFERNETYSPVHALRPPALDKREQLLPFTVRTVTSDEQLAKAVSIRHRAYGRHVPSLAEQLRSPEPLDSASGCVVLLAESKLDGEPVGTMRIQTNRYRPLALESSVTLPHRFAGCSLAEATRLGVSLGRVGHAVRTALFKAYYEYCTMVGVEWMVIAGRAPLDRLYHGLLFQDVFPDAPAVPLKHAANIPHRILSLEVAAVEPKWGAVNHPLYDYFFRTAHPDMQLAEEEPRMMTAAMAAKPRLVANA